jgi:hypothetical protein
MASDASIDNPWSAGNKSKKKTNTSFGFDFGDLDSADKGFNFDGDGGETKATDDGEYAVDLYQPATARTNWSCRDSVQ